MASLRRSGLLALLSVALVLLSLLAGGATAKRTGQLTVFWGRNKNEGSLREACDTGLYTTVIISFYSVFGHGRYWGDLSGHPMNGDAVLDGIDFFVDNGGADHYDELAWRLNWYGRYGGGKKALHLTATPRCGYPDWRLEKALSTGLFERLHVRFYDDANCSYNHAGLKGVMEQWNKWTAKYPRSSVYLGLIAANVPGKNDMVNLKQLYYDLLPNVQKAANYGGVMLWDRFYDKQTGYGKAVTYWA
ncbi:hypothetical protein PR202_ga12788 [Eleusine coracana subsp. coracana]|uniref:GH18 domain-containing protein n=1 Tax=Eleusine coracana subsp. coracana TaxID=191504 RepID=A0AAV5CD44_ELECO|nr:hypothetical protein PR202_ga12788 [Eleusine coracana subsp. coracana]